MSKTRRWYAVYDWTVHPSNPGHGFANAKKAIAFSSKGKRDAFLASRDDFDFSAKPITRKAAMKMLGRYYDDPRRKGLELDSIGGDMVVLWESSM